MAADCVIRILTGPESGQEFRCAGPETVIGRAARCAIRLTPASISYEHAAIIRTGDDFFIENLSANGTLLNEERITGRTKLRLRDRIRLSPDVTARIQSLPSAGAAGSSRRWLLILVVLMLIAGVAVVIWDPFAEDTGSQSWGRAYAQLLQYTRAEVDAKRLPPESLTLLQDGWRLERANVHPDAVQKWIRLRVVLAKEAPQLAASSDAHKNALDALVHPKPNTPKPDNDQLGASLIQFTERMARNR